MNIVICILDEISFKGRSDIIVVVDVSKKKLIWIPRDIYIPEIKTKIGNCISQCGKQKLIHVINNLKIGIIVHKCVILLPKYVDNIFSKIGSVNIRLNQKLLFYYPIFSRFYLLYSKDKSELHKYILPEQICNKYSGPYSFSDNLLYYIIGFLPPIVKLTKIRMHQFIGARFTIDSRNFKPIENKIKSKIKNNILDYNYTNTNLKCNEIELESHLLDYISLKHKNTYPDLQRIMRQQILFKYIINKSDINKIKFLENIEDTNGIDEDVVNILKKIDKTWTVNYIDNSIFKIYNEKDLNGKIKMSCIIYNKKKYRI